MLKKLLIVLGILLVLGFMAVWGAELWLMRTLPEKLNANEDRQYDVLFEEVDIKLFEGTILLQGISIKPLKTGMPTTVSGSMNFLKLGQVKMLEFIFGDAADIGELTLDRPVFTLVREDSVTQEASEFSKAIQDLFGDLVSRGVIHNFTLTEGSGEFYTKSDTLKKFGSFDGFSIIAKNLETDTVILNYAIPFKLESIETRVQNLAINLESDLTFRVNDLQLDSKTESVDLFGVSLKYDDSNLEASKRSEYQTDFIEIDLKHFRIDRLAANSNIYGNWSVIADKATIDSLVLHDVRNKNKPRPDEPEKPMFEGMVEKIPFPLILDTLVVINSSITYAEVGLGKAVPAELVFGDMQAEIYNLASIDSLQPEVMVINSKAVLNKIAPVTMDVNVKYTKENESFSLLATVAPFDLAGLSPVLQRLLEVKITSGRLQRLEMTMDAGRYTSNNTLIFDYENLEIEVLDSSNKKKGLISKVANLLASKQNMPEFRNHRTAKYATDRNIHRGTFNYIWNSTRDGIKEIVPSDVALILLQNSDR